MLKLCDIRDIPSNVAGNHNISAVEVKTAHQSYIVLNTTDGFKVYLNRCPHLGVPLNWQPDQFLDDSEDLLKCSTHGALFLPNNGYCVQGPCAGQHLEFVPFDVNEGALYIKGVFTE